jgi:hypothetical protein
LDQRRIDGETKLVFIDSAEHGLCEPSYPNWLHLSGKQWPILASYLNTVTVSRIPYEVYLPCNSGQAQTAWVSPSSDAWDSLLAAKNLDVQKKVDSGKYSKEDRELWLLVVGDRSNDLSSTLIMGQELKDTLDRCSFDFNMSNFDRVWALSESSGIAQCIYPWIEPDCTDRYRQ